MGTEDPLAADQEGDRRLQGRRHEKVPPGVVDVALQPILDFVSVLNAG